MFEEEKGSLQPRGLRDYLLAHGRPVVTLAQAAELLRLPEREAARALLRLRRAGEMFSPSRGLYLAVPPQYRDWGALPALDFVDPMLRGGGFEYYVALLSAAELYGAAHQRPQAFQVVVDRRVEDRDFGRVRVKFYTSKRAGVAPTELRNTDTGQVRVSTPAVTALDLATRPNESGGLSNVATVLVELVEDDKLEARLVEEAAEHFPHSSMRRLGWLLDKIDSGVGTDSLNEWILSRAAPGSRPGVLLDPARARRGRTDPRWGIIKNSDVEPDL
ncbi:MAG: type IV toxin-antitoxin system AbiEi family antitoxin domain-containing protein [Nocardioidaceae bacterium]